MIAIYEVWECKGVVQCLSRAMIYPTFSELLQVYQHIYLIFYMYIQYAFSRLTVHQFVRPEISLNKLALSGHC